MGIKVETLVLGNGKSRPSRGSSVIVHYTGRLEDGTIFDSSRDRNEPFVFILGAGQVIRGWEEEEAVASMTKGQIIKLTCPPDYAYGVKGFPPMIPTNATLIFEVELIDMMTD